MKLDGRVDHIHPDRGAVGLRLANERTTKITVVHLERATRSSHDVEVVGIVSISDDHFPDQFVSIEGDVGDGRDVRGQRSKGSRRVRCGR